MKTLQIAAGMILAAALSAGCESKPQANYDYLGLVKVSGTVKLDGEPLSSAAVKFESEDGQFSIGTTDESGKYSLQFDSEKQGATPGVKTVRISTRVAIGEEEGLEEGGEEESEEGAESARPKAEERVPAKYNTESELNRTVEPGREQTFDFDLKTE